MATSDYLKLITVEHKNSPRFNETVELSCDAFAQGQYVLKSLSADFDVDTAVGKQLDVVGEWVGKSRHVNIDLIGVFFEWDNEEYDVGWDEGIWKQEFDIDTQTTALDDFTYRKVIYAKIAANHWDGTADSLYDIFEETFGGQYHFAVFDNLDMSFNLVVAGQRLTKLDEAILKSGDLTLHPVGVRINEIDTAKDGGKVFAWDVEESVALAGWDIGKFPLNILSDNTPATTSAEP